MRFGLVLPTYIDTDQRRRWAEASLASLAKTEVVGLEETPLLLIVHKGAESAAASARQSFYQFELQITAQAPDIHSNDGVYTWCCYQIIEHIPSVTHIALITDDWLYNPRWLLELQKLVHRHPKALANWVYRSAYEEIHKTLRVDASGDVLVRSINAGGLSPVEEWKTWNLDWRQVPREAGNLGRLSLDLLHPQQRPGERWVTPKSYIVNIGLRGVCQRPETEDFAVDFVGMPVEEPIMLPIASTASSLSVPPTQASTEPFSATVDLPNGYQLNVTLRRKGAQ